MNPCQGHLMELKLAAISALSYDDFWMMFGEGKHPHFRELLDSKVRRNISFGIIYSTYFISFLDIAIPYQSCLPILASKRCSVLIFFLSPRIFRLGA